MSEDFPILFSWQSEIRKKELALGCPKTIPFSLLAPHEKQAQHNHGQTLKRLAERGGLSPDEAVAVLEDREWHRMAKEESISRLNELVTSPTTPERTDK